MQTIDEIYIHADPEAIYYAAVSIEAWPQILPHYRWVTIFAQSGNRRWVEMAAWRGWFPVKWISEQWCDRSTLRVYYTHIGGATKGMGVLWHIQPHEDGARVLLVHELALTQPIIRSRLGQWMVGHWFVKPVAQKTLSHLKRYLEDKQCAEQSSPDLVR